MSRSGMRSVKENPSHIFTLGDHLNIHSAENMECVLCARQRARSWGSTDDLGSPLRGLQPNDRSLQEEKF